MNRPELIETFRNWINEHTPQHIYCTNEFTENKLSKLLSLEADGDILFENDEIVVGAYEYTYELTAEKSLDSHPHCFAFQAVGVGCKENITESDYELADYSEASFIIKAMS